MDQRGFTKAGHGKPLLLLHSFGVSLSRATTSVKGKRSSVLRLKCFNQSGRAWYIFYPATWVDNDIDFCIFSLHLHRPPPDTNNSPASKHSSPSTTMAPSHPVKSSPSQAADRASQDQPVSLPQTRLDTAHWWRHKNLRTLNLLLLVPLLSIFSQG